MKKEEISPGPREKDRTDHELAQLRVRERDDRGDSKTENERTRIRRIQYFFSGYFLYYVTVSTVSKCCFFFSEFFFL